MKRVIILLVLLIMYASDLKSQVQITTIEDHLAEALTAHFEGRVRLNEVPGIVRTDSLNVLIDKSYSLYSLVLEEELKERITFMSEEEIKERVLGNSASMGVSIITPLEFKKEGFQFRIVDVSAKQEKDQVLFASTDSSIFELYYDCNKNQYRLRTILEVGN